MADSVTIEASGREVRITNPGKTYFPGRGFTKMDLVEYYLAVAKGALRGCRERPSILHRWPNGVDAPDDAFYQKRVPRQRPEWIETCIIRFPSGRSAEMLVIDDAATLAWAVNLGCIDINPWPVRRADLDRPDELRVDLDPTPGTPFEQVRETALTAHDVLTEHGLAGFPKTSGKRGIHLNVRIDPRWGFTTVRRAALALAREVERQLPDVATTAWWKEERVGVFVDYNQNARDRTVASAYSVRPVPEATVSCPLTWDEVADVEPGDLRLDTVPQRFASFGDPAATIDDAAGTLESLLDLADRDEAGGLSDAPWPPHFPKADNEPTRVAPSRARRRPPT